MFIIVRVCNSGDHYTKKEDMLVSFYRLCYVTLILVSVVSYSKGDETGCNDWTISNDEVCCVKCHPGNRLVKECGKDPTLLCKPCEANTYSTNPTSFSCLRCTQCTGVQFVLKPCNATSDTVCGCRDGFRCGNEKCSFCVTECKEGQEPTDDRSCRKCPEGTFNDKIHSMCKKRKESCPNGQIMETTENAFRDHKCISNNEIGKNIKIPTVKKTTESNKIDTLLVVSEKKDKMKWVPVGIAGGVAVLAVLCIIASVISCVKAQSKTEKPKPDTSDQELSEESRIMVQVDQEACSFHHPEQEQGGSSESISSQDSDTKLIV